jgi:hypothetical protein
VLLSDTAQHLKEANSPYRNFPGWKRHKTSRFDFLPATKIKYCLHYGQSKITNTEEYYILGYNAVYSGSISEITKKRQAANRARWLPAGMFVYFQVLMMEALFSSDVYKRLPHYKSEDRWFDSR